MKVYIVGSYGTCLYTQMYVKDGWEVVYNIKDADLVQFTGGEDVNPALYGCGVHPTTMFNEARDVIEQQVFDECRERNIPMVGICRGGQFLNVMCGGRMYQHVNGHAIAGTHKTKDMGSGFVCEATSTHHQMMIPDKGDAFVLGYVSPSLCAYKDYVDSDGKIYTVEPEEDDIDVEVVHYPYQNVLCFQPHPEYASGEGCREWFFSLVLKALFGDDTRYHKLVYGEKDILRQVPVAAVDAADWDEEEEEEFE